MATLDPDFLALLCCPLTHQPLREAEPAELEQVNRRIEAGEITSKGGEPWHEALDTLLLTADGRYGYRYDVFPRLAPDDALILHEA